MFYENRLLEILENYERIFIYVSKNEEIPTKNLIKILLESNKKVIVPKSHPKTNTISPHLITSLDDLEEGNYGIMEPKSNLPEYDKSIIDIYVVPGTKFDLQGNRKGHGRGYMDRFLENVKNQKPIIALCYESQLVEKLDSSKMNGWDIPVDLILTDRREVLCNDKYNF
jgi:5-formyltetrahydrofolate cyclo-ligase